MRNILLRETEYFKITNILGFSRKNIIRIYDQTVNTILMNSNHFNNPTSLLLHIKHSIIYAQAEI